MKQLFATTARGFEELLKNELTELGAIECHIAQGGVHYTADDATLYRTLLWSRLSSRILFPIAKGKIFTDLDLYSLVINQNWQQIFRVNSTFFVDFNGTNEAIRHSQFGAMRVKDGIVDYFEQQGLPRPNVDKNQPAIRLHAYLNRDELVLSLDLSGEALHLRGYRTTTGLAPLRETLASAVVIRSNWQKDTPLIDPMCGSGTLLIEAVQMACHIAPNLTRTHWGFDGWKAHNETIWQAVKQEAQEKAQQGVENFTQKSGRIYGFDLDSNVLEKAKQNAERAGVGAMIQWQQGDIADLHNPCQEQIGTVICNPPYGERLGATPALIALYAILGQKLKSEFLGWNVSVLSSEPTLLDCLHMRAYRQFKAKNGQLDCVQKNYTISERASAVVNSANSTVNTPPSIAAAFANRLQKNRKKIEKWAKKEGLEAYRLYDADLPEYNFALDVYGEYLVLQEYAPPKRIDENKARQRILDAITAILNVMEIDTNKLILKVRQKQKGHKQYEKLAHKGEYFYIKEYHTKLWVNLTDYLDTGLFLDHRITRKMLGEMAKGKDFLNLFAYTGAGTVHAVLGGAKSTTTVDMSHTYLNWAEQNLILNGYRVGKTHRLIQADCLKWLSHCRDKFDIIFVDPPTFSNSKRMEDSFEVERDQGKLFRQLAKILRPNGVIIFSNNKRSFKIDNKALADLGLQAKEISQKTLPLDFERHPKIHHCWFITWQAISVAEEQGEIW